MKKIQGAVLKEAFSICEVSNKVIKLKIKQRYFDRKLSLQLSDLTETSTEGLIFLGMANMEGGSMRGQYLSNIFVLTSSE